MIKLSILTATYNRANFLEILYKSIVDNLYDRMDIEWLIMDDGSEDNTQEIIKNFIEKNHLEIKTFKQSNSGKMQAINNLMEHVTGELVMVCDSDDHFENDAFKQIYNKRDILLQDDSLYGLVFLKNESPNKLSGNKFKNENMKTKMFDMYFKDSITGEKAIVFKTEIRKKYKHELEKNEKFITEARMFYKIDDKYSVKCYNIVIEEGMYQSDGYTKNISSTFLKYPKGYFQYFKEILEKPMNGVKLNKRLYALKHYILFKELCHYKKIRINNISNQILYYFLIIPGKIMTKIKLKHWNV